MSIEEKSSVEKMMCGKFNKMLSLLLTNCSVIFLVGGFLYYKTFLAHFGIDSNAFFSLSDYIVASIDIVIYSVLNVIVALIIISIQMKNNFLSVLLRGFFILSIVVQMGMLLIFSFRPNVFLFMGSPFSVALSIVGSLIYSFAYVILPSLALKYCKKNLEIFTITVFAILFIITIPLYASKSAYETNKWNMFKNNAVKINTLNADLSNLRIILINGSYYFLMSDNSKKITIIPKSTIVSVELIKS